MEHTKGPWEFDGTCYINADDGQKMIAQIRGWGWLQYLGEEKATAIQESNARLIAAAPELLEALKYARRFLKTEDVDMKFIDEAIAKATKEG